jgi:hypothetical protein
VNIHFYLLITHKKSGPRAEYCKGNGMREERKEEEREEEKGEKN